MYKNENGVSYLLAIVDNEMGYHGFFFILGETNMQKGSSPL